MTTDARDTRDPTQGQLTVMLRDAKRVLGMEAIDTLLMAGTDISISDHDTGCQVRLYAKGDFSTAIWCGSVWYSQAYEFNDRNKILGVQPEFSEPAVVSKIATFFDGVRIALEVKRKAETEANAERGVSEAIDRAQRIERARRALLGSSP